MNDLFAVNEPFSADKWCELWRQEADARNALWKKYQQLRSITKELAAALERQLPMTEEHCEVKNQAMLNWNEFLKAERS